MLLKAQELPKDVDAVEPEKDVEEESAAKDDASAANEPFENNTCMDIYSSKWWANNHHLVFVSAHLLVCVQKQTSNLVDGCFRFLESVQSDMVIES